MNIIPFVLSISVLIVLAIVLLIGRKCGISLRKILLYSTIFLFIVTALLLVSIFILDRQSIETPSDYNVYLYNGLVSFALWYNIVPPLFLVFTIIIYMLRFLKKMMKI